MNQNLNELAAKVHQANKKWWQDLETGKPIDRNKGELLMLVITELAEACEGIRKNLMDDKLPHRTMEEVEMADAFIRLLDFAGGFEIKIINFAWPDCGGWGTDNKAENLLEISKPIFDAHSVIIGRGDASWKISYALASIRAYCKKYNLDLMGAFEEKMAYNATRKDHTHEARRLAGGKKF